MIADREDIKLHMPTLQGYAENSSIKFILEIGPDFGNGSTRAFLAGAGMRDEENPLYWVTVDIDDHILPECRPSLPYWFMVEGDSRSAQTVETVKDVIFDNFPGLNLPDIIFIDTIHEKQFLAAELENWKVFAHPKTMWLFHDTWMLGQYNTMTDAIKEFAERSKNGPIEYMYVDLSKECNGLGALFPVLE